MNEQTFWRLKLLALLHDPPNKVWHIQRHKAEAARLFEQLTGQPLSDERRALRQHLSRTERNLGTRADQVASGADRPALGEWRAGTQVATSFPKAPIVTHPLGGPPLQLGDAGEVPPLHGLSDAVEGDDAEPAFFDAVAAMQPSDAHPTQLRQAFVAAWRRLPAAAGQQAAQDWTLVPADSRIPDHSIWDHTRMSSALAFLVGSKEKGAAEPQEQTPILLSVQVGPVDRFVSAARSTRDLWFGSYVLAELALAAMAPIVRRYGPDAIVYPDLRGNERFDAWLVQEGWAAALAEDGRNPHTQAALIPNKFTAIVPRGADGGDHLLPVRTLAERCRQAALDRWHQLAGAALEKLQRKGLPIDEDAWSDQIATALRVRWAAMPWPWRQAELTDLTEGHGLPCQESPDAGGPPEVPAAAHARRARLYHGVPAATIAHHERAQRAFLGVSPTYFAMERGFDYALVHYQLGLRLQERGEAGDEPTPEPRPGVTCKVCHERPTIERATPGQRIDAARKANEQAWSVLGELERENERVCAVCATKRHGHEDDTLRGAWGGAEVPSDALVPFPSTAMIAAASFLQRWLEGGEGTAEADARAAALATALDEHPRVVRALKTQQPADLPSLARWPHPIGRWEAQVLFPDALEAELKRIYTINGRQTEPPKELLAASRRVAAIAELDPRFAVVRLDGDSFGKLMRGEAGAGTWRSVLHPSAVAKILASAAHKEAGWRELLDARRIITPSTQALISRALATFAHTLAPWVIEREYHGRLVYAGGDDILALLPAREALPAIRRLRELFAAGWVHDRWPGLRTTDPLTTGEPKDRFGVLGSEEHSQPLALPIDGLVVPMLGPNVSLSASAVVGHFKTPLQLMLRRSKSLLDLAKMESEGGGGTAVSSHSRGGEKARAVLGPEMLDAFERVVDSLQTGALASRTPFKLHADVQTLEVALSAEADRARIQRWLTHHIEDPEPNIEDLAALFTGTNPARAGEQRLLLARALALAEAE